MGHVAVRPGHAAQERGRSGFARRRPHTSAGVPTAGTAGAALTAYAAAAHLPVRVYAPESTPKPILDTIRTLGADLQLVSGHIGDAGKLARAFAAETGYFD